MDCARQRHHTSQVFRLAEDIVNASQAIATPSQGLEQAMARWQRQGYQVAYHDDYLVQLYRRELPDKLLATTALAAFIALGMVLVVRLGMQPWHIILLATTNDDRVITHHQRSRGLPPQ